MAPKSRTAARESAPATNSEPVTVTYRRRELPALARWLYRFAERRIDKASDQSAFFGCARVAKKAADDYAEDRQGIISSHRDKDKSTKERVEFKDEVEMLDKLAELDAQKVKLTFPQHIKDAMIPTALKEKAENGDARVAFKLALGDLYAD